MRSRRIVLIGVPPLVRDLVDALVAGSGTLELVGEYDDSTDALAELDGTPADVVVTTEAGHDRARQLLRHWPNARVVVLSGDGRQTSTFELLLAERVVGDVSVDTLLAELQRTDQLDD